MSMGISCDTFWAMTPKAVQQFQVGYNKQKQKQDEEAIQLSDYQAWLAGAYVTNAIAACFDKRSKYPQRPATIKEPEKTAREEADDFASFARRMNANFKKKGGER